MLEQSSAHPAVEDVPGITSSQQAGLVGEIVVSLARICLRGSDSVWPVAVALSVFGPTQHGPPILHGCRPQHLRIAALILTRFTQTKSMHTRIMLGCRQVSAVAQANQSCTSIAVPQVQTVLNHVAVASTDVQARCPLTAGTPGRLDRGGQVLVEGRPRAVGPG